MGMYDRLTKKFVQYTDLTVCGCLYETAHHVSEFDSPKFQALIAEMKQKLPKYSTGLAANQLGQPYQLFILEYMPSKTSRRIYDQHFIELQPIDMTVVINPVITKVSSTKSVFWHGCLSAINEMMGELATYEEIEFEAFDEHGQAYQKKLTDIGSVIFQHEFRHLLGGLYLDYASNLMAREKLRSKFNKRELMPYRVIKDDSVPFLLPDYQVGETIEEYRARKKA